MIVDAVVLALVGILAVLLPFSTAYRSRLTRRLADQAGAQVPAAQVPALEARVTRRARAMGTGVVVGGVLLFVTALLWPEGSEAPSGGYVLISLMFVFGAAGLALVEILRPGEVADGPRWARTTTPTMADYVPAHARVLSWTFTGVGLAVLLLTLALTQTRWFDAETVVRSPVPFLVAAVPVLAGLSELAARRVLDAAQPARDEVELYWQDAVRASTLLSLTTPSALVGLLGLVVSGAVLDDAASAAAAASGQIGPGWSLWLLIAGYALPFVLVIVAVIVVTRWDHAEPVHFRHRLWDERPASVEA